MARAKSKTGKEQKSEDRDAFISVTEVEERFFPNSRSRRTEERVPLDVETHRRVKDALSDISSKD